jgi:hypothetical protein
MATNSDTVRETAAAARLSNLDKVHLSQLTRAIESARELGDKLPKDLHYKEEIALTFRLTASPGRRP